MKRSTSLALAVSVCALLAGGTGVNGHATALRAAQAQPTNTTAHSVSTKLLRGKAWADAVYGTTLFWTDTRGTCADTKSPAQFALMRSNISTFAPRRVSTFLPGLPGTLQVSKDWFVVTVGSRFVVRCISTAERVIAISRRHGSDTPSAPSGPEVALQAISKATSTVIGF